MLARQIDLEADALRPLKEVPVVAGPAGGGVFVAIGVGKRPFQVGIAGRGRRRQGGFQRNPWRVLRKDDKSPAPGTLDADRGCVLIAFRPGDSLVVIRAAPGVVGGPGSRRGHLENPTWLSARRRPDDEKVMGVDRRAVAALRRQGDAIGAGGPALTDAEFQRGLPAAAFDRALVRRILPPRAGDGAFHHGCEGRAVSENRHPVPVRAGAHVQTHRAAARIGKGIGIAPDLAASAEHPRIIIAMSENRFAALCGGQAEVRNIGGHLFL